MMAAVRGRNTAPERAVRAALFAAGYRYRLHRKDLAGSPDIVLPRHHVAVFVHGCFWHGHECPKGRRPTSNVDFWNAKLDRNMARDRENRTSLETAGWKVFTVWECAVPQGAAAAATAQQLQQALPRQAADLQTQAAKRDQAYADFLPRLMDLRWAKAVFLAAQDDELKKPCPPPAAAMPQAGVGAGVAPAPAAPPPQPPGTARLSHSEMAQMLAGLPPIVRLQRLRLVPRNESACFTPADDAELARLEEQEAQLSEEYAHDTEEMSGYEALHNTVKVLFGPNDPLTTESQEDINEIKEDLATIHSEWLDAEERAEELRSKPPCPPKVLYFVGGGFGAASRTATYDDGFKVRGATGLFDVNAGARVPIAEGLFLGARLGVMAPFAGSSREFATTKLNWAVMPEVELSLNLPSFKTFSDALLADYVKHGVSQPKRPLQPLPVAFVTLGPAIGGLSSGSSFPGFAYSNTQTSVGITTSVGLEVPLSDNISVYGQFRYIGFPMTTFQSPYGSFKRDENVYAGTIGIKFNITNWTTNVIP
jgi:DNA mismatch endonuclease (patch repair protein)